MVFNFNGFDSDFVVETPISPWVLHTSTDLQYTIGHPAGWDVEEERSEWAADYFFGLESELHVYRNDLDPADVPSLNAWVRGYVDLFAPEDGLETGRLQETVVMGFPARYLPFTYLDESGTVSGVYLVTQVSTTTVFELVYFDNDDDRTVETMLDFASTLKVDVATGDQASI